jgi:hypothetical protein
MNLNRYLCVLAALGAAAMIVGAGVAQADSGPPGDIPDNQAFVTFRGSGYSLKVPEGWPRTRQGVRVAFADKYNSISIVTSELDQRPTVGSVTKVELRVLRKTTKGFAQPKVTTAKRQAGTAILVTYRATSAPSAVTGKTVINDVER